MSNDVTVFDLAAARAGALQSLTQETPAIEAAPAPESPVAPAPPQEAQPAATEPEAPVATTPPLPLSQVEIKHRGKTVVIDDPEDLKALAQKGFDYTAKTQELAEAKRQLEAREQTWLQREQQVVEFLADKARVAAYLQQSTGQLQAQPQAQPVGQSPDDLLTVGQVQQLLAQQEQRLSQAVQQETSRVREQMPQVAELVQVRQAWAQDVDQHLASLQKKYPELQAVDDYPMAMKTRMRDYLQANPGQVSNLETAKAIIHDWSKAQAQKIRGLIDSQTKSTLARQASTAKPAILPPGGATTTQSGADTSGMRIGDPRLTAIVAAALQGAKG